MNDPAARAPPVYSSAAENSPPTNAPFTFFGTLLADTKMSVCNYVFNPLFLKVCILCQKDKFILTSADSETELC